MNPLRSISAFFSVPNHPKVGQCRELQAELSDVLQVLDLQAGAIPRALMAAGPASLRMGGSKELLSV